jgi:cytochrome c oxidase subunit 2
MKPRAWMRRSGAPSYRLVAALACVAFAAAGCAKNAPLDTLRPQGPIAHQIYGLWNIVFILAVVVFVLVEGAIVFALFRFRRRKGDDSSPKQTHGNTRLELTWTILPAVLLAVLAFLTVPTIFALAREPKGAMQIQVQAQQWWWKYHYPKQKGIDAPFTNANELHIPVGQPIWLTLNSNDVIHSWWAPALAGKQDVVPSRTNHLKIEATHPGTYLGTCVEFCGLSHANMRLRVIAQTPADFAKWAANQAQNLKMPTSALGQKGMKIFLAQQCVGCHTIRGTAAAGNVGPDLTHVATRETFAGGIFAFNTHNLRKWLTDAPAEKPGSKMPAGVATMGLSKSDISALIAFLEGLK